MVVGVHWGGLWMDPPHINKGYHCTWGSLFRLETLPPGLYETYCRWIWLLEEMIWGFSLENVEENASDPLSRKLDVCFLHELRWKDRKTRYCQMFLCVLILNAVLWFTFAERCWIKLVSCAMIAIAGPPPRTDSSRLTHCKLALEHASAPEALGKTSREAILCEARQVAQWCRL